MQPRRFSTEICECDQQEQAGTRQAHLIVWMTCSKTLEKKAPVTQAVRANFPAWNQAQDWEAPISNMCMCADSSRAGTSLKQRSATTTWPPMCSASRLRATGAPGASKGKLRRFEELAGRNAKKPRHGCLRCTISEMILWRLSLNRALLAYFDAFPSQKYSK